MSKQVLRNAEEVGTFTGYSVICLARGFGAGGRLTCFDVSEEWAKIARKYWQKAGLAVQIDLLLGDARQLVSAFTNMAPLDLVFIDANKPGYDLYYESLLPRVRVGELFIFDNMLRGGDVPLEDAGDAAVDALNKKLARDPRVESVLLLLVDGLNLCRKI